MEPEPSGFGALRLVTGIFLLVWQPTTAGWLASAPPAFFNPPLLSPASLFDGFPSALGLWLVEMGILGLVCLMTLGVRARLCTGALCVVGVTLRSFAYSFGKIDHDIILWLFLGCMAFSGWGRTVALVPDRPSRYDSPERCTSLLAVGLAFGMFTAGFEKALVWVDFNPATSGFLSWFYNGYYTLGRQYLLAPEVLWWPRWVPEILDYGAVLFECLGLLVLLTGPVVWRCWLLVACLFHLSNTLLLNIAFDIHAPVILAFCNLSRVERQIEQWWSVAQSRWAIVTGLTGFGAFALFSDSQPLWSYWTGPAGSETAVVMRLLFSVGLWLGIVGVQASSTLTLVRQRWYTAESRPQPSVVR